MSNALLLALITLRHLYSILAHNFYLNLFPIVTVHKSYHIDSFCYHVSVPNLIVINQLPNDRPIQSGLIC